jgi:glutamate-1-semialdehyde 2,1-aminomutase
MALHVVAQLADGIEAAAARYGLPWRAHRLGGRSGYCLEPDLPRNAAEAERSIDPELVDTRRLHMANRGVWDAIASAGPAVSFAHAEDDVDEYLGALDAFLADVVA